MRYKPKKGLVCWSNACNDKIEPYQYILILYFMTIKLMALWRQSEGFTLQSAASGSQAVSTSFTCTPVGHYTSCSTSCKVRAIVPGTCT